MTAMPTWGDFMTPTLRLLSDATPRSLRELKTQVAAVAMTAEQREALLDSGEPNTDNRIGWAASYLTRVGALERPARGMYRITQLGHELLAKFPSGINEVQLRAYAQEDDQWWTSKTSTAAVATSAMDANADTAVVDPVEQIETGLARIHSDVAADLLSRLNAREPEFFEQRCSTC